MKRFAALLMGGIGAAAFVALITRPTHRVAVVPIQWDPELSARQVTERLASKLRQLGASSVVAEKFGAPIVASSSAPILSPGGRLVVDDGGIIAMVIDASEVF